VALHFGWRGPGHLSRVGGGAWTPASLGANLLGWIDAEQSGTVTQNATLVSAWADSVSPGSRSFAQATGTLKPVYNATGLNSRPSIIYDGIDDETTLASVPYPTSGAFEIWALVKQDALAADATVRNDHRLGQRLGATTLNFRRNVVSGVNRAQAAVGNGTSDVTFTNTAVDFSGVCVVRMILDGVNGQWTSTALPVRPPPSLPASPPHALASAPAPRPLPTCSGRAASTTSPSPVRSA
jgi:hypothetical protein